MNNADYQRSDVPCHDVSSRRRRTFRFMRIASLWVGLWAIILLLTRGTIHAAPAGETQPAYTQSQSTPSISGLASHSPSQSSALSESANTRRQLWGLSEAQWRRYQSLRQGIRGSLSPATLSPIEVLGIHARNEEERRRYAQRWVELLYEDTERILAFQREYQAAWQRLYPKLRLFSDLPPRTALATVKSTDRVLFFTKPDCPPCTVPLARLLKQLSNKRIAGLDIYLLGISHDDQAVRDWATAHGIDPALVHAHTITLNHDNGTLARLAPALTPLPHIMRNHNGALAPIEPEAF